MHWNSECVCVSTQNICCVNITLHGYAIILGCPFTSCFSSSNRFAWAHPSQGDDMGARTSKSQCMKPFQASPCITSANIPLAETSHMAESRVMVWRRSPHPLWEGAAKLHGKREWMKGGVNNWCQLFHRNPPHLSFVSWIPELPALPLQLLLLFCEAPPCLNNFPFWNPPTLLVAM